VSLKKEDWRRDFHGLFKVPLYLVVPILGALSCIFLLYFLSNNVEIASAMWFGVGLLVFSVLALKTRGTSTKEQHVATGNHSD